MRSLAMVVTLSCSGMVLAGELVGRADQAVEDAGLGIGVTGAFDQVVLRPRPSLVKLKGGDRRAGHVVAALDNDAGDVCKPPRVAQQLPLLHPAGMNEIMVLDAGESQRELVLAERRAGPGVRGERDGLALPEAPRLGGRDPFGTIVARQAAAERCDHVGTLHGRDLGNQALPFVRKELRGAVLIVPIEL